MIVPGKPPKYVYSNRSLICSRRKYAKNFEINLILVCLTLLLCLQAITARSSPAIDMVLLPQTAEQTASAS
jgi:hypothetical protein